MISPACKKDKAPKSASPSGEQSISLMSYNILHAKKETRPGYLWGDPDDRKDRVIALLKKYNPDILCAQEDMYIQGQYIKQNTGLGKSGLSRDAGTPTGTNGEFDAVYYNKERFTPKKWGHFWLSLTPDKVSIGWDASVQRICNWVLLADKNTGSSFYVFNTHLDNVGKQSRIHSAALILDSIKAIVKGYPVVLTGDMNTTPQSTGSMEYRAILKSSRDISATAPEGPSATFNGGDGRVPKETIDYVYVSSGVDVLTYGVLTDSTKNGLFPSDHFPVLTKMKMK
jgi:endonuclease/exonuclease/phosphatase family metal-dependent hydrolase